VFHIFVTKMFSLFCHFFDFSLLHPNFHGFLPLIAHVGIKTMQRRIEIMILIKNF